MSTKMDDWQLTKKIAENRKAYKKFKLSQLTSDYNSYIDLKRTCEKEIKKRKREYEVRISHEAKKNPKLFFSYIRNKKYVRNNIGPLLINDNKLISDVKNMASIPNSTSVESLLRKIKQKFLPLWIYFKVPMEKSSS